MDTQYTFDAERNSYFLGHDLRVSENETDATIIVNVKDGMLAFNVKDDTIRRSWPSDVQDAADKIGDDETQELYEIVQRDFWREAHHFAGEHGFNAVGSGGRSGGWCCVYETGHLDVADIIEPAGEDKETVAKFLRFAFETCARIADDGGYHDQFYDRMREAAESFRNPVRCPNCDQYIDPREPAQDHGENCLAGVVISTLLDRDHEPDSLDVTKIDVNQLWDRFGGPMVNWAAEVMGIDWFPDAPETETDK